jgi:putative ABC transport system permease protein
MNWMRDLRFAQRLLRQRPVASLLIVAMLAGGIGLNVAIFSVVEAFLLRPLPYPAADRLIKVESLSDDREIGVSFPDYLDWRQRSRSFVDLAYIDPTVLANVNFGGGTEAAQATLTTSNLFSILGVRPFLGRWFLPEDDRPGTACAALLSHSLWQRRFAADPHVLGRKVLIEGSPCSVVGVMPVAFRFPVQTDVWLPVWLLLDRNNRMARFDSVVGRLRPGVTLAQARQDIGGVARALAQELPLSNGGVGAQAVPLRNVWTDDIRQPLLLLAGACCFVLLMTCANVANLLLSRALAREREIAIRTALGAGWQRILRQLTAEHLVLVAVGGVLGLALAHLGVAAIARAIPIVLPSWVGFGIDWTAAGYAACLSVLAGLLFGLAPMAQLARTDLVASLRAGHAAGTDRTRRWLRSSLVVIEIALALILLAGASLMVTSFLRLRQVDPGFQPAGVIAADVNLTYYEGEKSPRGRYSQLMQLCLLRVAQLPGVQAAAADGNLPLSGQDVWDRQQVTLFGQSAEAQTHNTVVNFQAVSPDYFKALQIGLVKGREFGPQDVVGQPRVALLGEEAVRRLWPHQDPIGGRLKLGPASSGAAWFTVVGVVRDVRQRSLAEKPGSDLFVPIFQAPRKRFIVLARARGNPRGLQQALRQALAATSPEIGVLKTATLEEIVASSIWIPCLWASLFTLFSALALLLAAGGIYGVMASSVRERTREIGVRMALGAQRPDVLRLMLAQSLKLALTGTALGLFIAAALHRSLSSLLFGVKAGDLWTLLEVATFLIAVVLAASWLATRKATHADPLIALRYD